MAEPIIFTITEAGKQAALNADADSAQLKINMTQVAVGASGYVVTGLETALTTEIKRGSIVSGDVEVVSNTLRFTSSMTADSITDVYEIGLMTDDNVLFALASSSTNPLFSLHHGITFVIGFGLSLQDVAAGSVTVSIDPNNSLAPVIMQNHVAATNPHPQYVALSRFQFLLEVMFPVGYLHHTNSEANPKPKFDQLLGIDTAWRRLAGKIIVGTDPNDDYIKDVGMTLGQKGMTIPAINNERPNVYPLYSKHIFERYNPDDVIETVWNVSANNTSVVEGGALRFTVTANNIVDGQILNWTILEGSLNSESNNIEVPDNTQLGTVILDNGIAIIDYSATPDDNTEESQKHVRLTVGAPANLSINVPINDIGKNETILHITQSTTNGVQLDEYYKQQSGAYPTATDKIRFIVDAGVDIIAPDTSTPALTDGVNWLAGSQIIVENHGRILGRGGDGGRSAYYYTMWDSKDRPQGLTSFNYSRPAAKGGDGGTAISGAIIVENHNIIMGGGGGGGGLGLYAKNGTIFYLGGGGTGGGAPFGRRSPNEATYTMYLNDPEFPYSKLPRAWSGSRAYTIIYHRVTERWLTHKDTFQGQRLSGGTGNWKNTRAVHFEMDIDASTTEYAKEGFVRYRAEQKLYSDIRQEITSPPLIMSQDASLDDFGIGGANLLPNLHHDPAGYIYALSNDIDGRPSVMDNTRGGNGGGLGENGESGIPSVFFGITLEPSASLSVIPDTDVAWRQPSAEGGLAGYIAEGDVTITNYSAGTTKGR